MTRTDRDLDQAGHSLMHVIAPAYTACLIHLAQEMHLLDGYGSKGGDEVLVSSSGRTIRVTDEHGQPDNIPVTGVEAAMIARMDLWSFLEGLRLKHGQLLREMRELNEMIVAGSRLRTPRHVVSPDDQKRNLCCTGQQGKHDAIAWGDPLCMMPAVKAGMCQAHYMAWYRARVRDNIDTSRDHEPV
jgi:hypothetical protein